MARTATAEWKGDLMGGSGHLALGSGAFAGPYSFATRFGDAVGANPEELLGAAHAACFAMALANTLAKAGHPATSVKATASVHLGKDDTGFKITRITLHAEAMIPDIDEATFKQQADAAKKGCPVSQALTGTEIVLDAKLKR